jgi:hypothetical protein
MADKKPKPKSKDVLYIEMLLKKILNHVKKPKKKSATQQKST